MEEFINSRNKKLKIEIQSDSEEAEEGKSGEESDNGNLNGSRTLRNRNKPSSGTKNSRKIVVVISKVPNFRSHARFRLQH